MGYQCVLYGDECVHRLECVTQDNADYNGLDEDSQEEGDNE